MSDARELVAAVSVETYQLDVVSNSGDYVAVGFPAVASMGPAPVVACSAQWAPNTTRVYFNNDKFNSAPAFNHSGKRIEQVRDRTGVSQHF